MSAPCRHHEWEPNFDASATWFECRRCGAIQDQQERVSGGEPLEYTDDYRWNRLAIYNGERLRGIVHTPEYDAEMAAEQARFEALA